MTAGAPATGTRLPGVVLPGFANAHSHAFHRALRGRTHGGGGSFWTWRDRMYAVAARLDPDSYLALARAAYAEGGTARTEWIAAPTRRPGAARRSATRAAHASASRSAKRRWTSSGGA